MPAYAFHPEYRLAVAALSVDWLVLIVVGFLFALAWRGKTNGRLTTREPPPPRTSAVRLWN